MIGAIVAMLGGAAGVERIMGSGETTQRLIRESEARVMAALQEHAKTEQSARDAITTKLVVIEGRTSWNAAALCAFNGAALHPYQPCWLTITQSDPLKTSDAYPGPAP